jgi:hypothetical protein
MVESSERAFVCFGRLTYIRKVTKIMIINATTALRILFVFVARGNLENENYF